MAASTQNQALSAILFLYRDVLELGPGWIEGFERPKRAARLPVVLTPAETHAVLAQLEGTKWLMASLLYGSGLRLMECLRLRDTRGQAKVAACVAGRCARRVPCA